MKAFNRILTVVAAVSLAAITGCAGKAGNSPTPLPAASSAAASADGSAQADAAAIMIQDFKYEFPGSVKPGSMVAVTNADSAPHTLTAKDEGGFDIQVPGGSTTIFQAPDAPGKYDIICTFHPQMTGTLVVQ